MRISPKRIGNSFESVFKNQALRQGWSVVRIPDGCLRINKNKIIPIKSPFDFVIGKDGVSVFLDCKTVEGDSFSFSKINPNQLKHLLFLHESKLQAGYLIYFRKSNRVLFSRAIDLVMVSKNESIKDSGIPLGCISDFNLDLFLER